MKLPYILALIPTLSLATVKPDPPKPQAPPTVIGVESVSAAASTSSATSEAHSASNSASESVSSATGGNANSTLSVNTVHPRQVGAVGQGSIIPPGCGAGGNAGGAGPNGTGFLGFSFVTSECHGWTYIATLTALGLKKDACEAAKRQNASRRAKRRGAPEVDCETLTQTPVPTQSASTAPKESESCASKAELRETVDRAFRCKQEQGK